MSAKSCLLDYANQSRRSYAGYGKIGFDRRFRLFQIEDYGETIRTWKHTEHLESFHWQTLVGHGAPPPYEGP